MSFDLIVFKTIKGKEYDIKKVEGAECRYNKKDMDDMSLWTEEEKAAETYISLSGRRVFLGKDINTSFIKELDNITFDYYQGDLRTSRVSVYRFDFSLSNELLDKDYSTILPKQYHGCGKLGLDFIRMTRAINYMSFTGFGWESTESLEYFDRGVPDPFRRDFICSTESNKFMVELPKGQYQIFFTTGDFSEPTFTKVHINNQQKWEPDGIIRAGCFEASLFRLRNRLAYSDFHIIPTFQFSSWEHL